MWKQDTGKGSIHFFVFAVLNNLFCCSYYPDRQITSLKSSASVPIQLAGSRSGCEPRLRTGGHQPRWQSSAVVWPWPSPAPSQRLRYGTVTRRCRGPNTTPREERESKESNQRKSSRAVFSPTYWQSRLAQSRWAKRQLLLLGICFIFFFLFKAVRWNLISAHECREAGTGEGGEGDWPRRLKSVHSFPR